MTIYVRIPFYLLNMSMIHLHSKETCFFPAMTSKNKLVR